MAKHDTQQKQRAGTDRTQGGRLRSQPAEGSPSPMASTGDLATKSNTRSAMNSRSSNSGRQARKSK
ncbi:hypothetical protein H8N03_12755 [Ramlibacter sp. USB13]|uniref:Uncharacterized protein n=1 Tax=Ramlibacter cellulosilyticus TaxID=2764187 RepID=A0A923MRE2_9BURK|nr:hypothetical protein [Ramlibacter cellulosilyticus]MBC5783818.1 hypothetical protein [Ramlibacter cellulosilyticus]